MIGVLTERYLPSEGQQEAQRRDQDDGGRAHTRYSADVLEYLPKSVRDGHASYR